MEESKQLNSFDYHDILHLHCMECYTTSCNEQQNCKINKCPAGCGMSCHACKMDDHLIICRNLTRPCLNVLYGCPYKMPSYQLARHMDTCPASSVHCGMEWNRYPIYSKTREKWMPFTERNPPKIKGQLDIELAFNDQKKLEMESFHKMKIGKMRILNYQNRKQVDKERIKLLEYQMGNGKNASRVGVGIAKEQNGGSSDSKLTDDDDAKVASFSKKYPSSEVCDSHDRAIASTNELVNDHLSDQSESLKSSVIKSNVKDIDTQIPLKDIDLNKSIAREEETTELVFTVNVQDQEYPSAKGSCFIEDTEHQITGFAQKYAECVASPYLTKHLGLNVRIETIPKFQNNDSMYSIPCQTFLRRDQYCSHFKNVHDDIHGGLNTWLQQRCPLAQYGCPFIRNRFRPGSKEGCLVYDQDIGSFAVKTSPVTIFTKGCSLTSLPFEILEKIVEFLDSFSIIQFSKTCKFTRDACRCLVQRRGIVLLDWKRGTFSDGTVSWKPYKKRWMFSPSFSHIREWKYTDEPSMGEHMRRCQFFKRSSRTQKCKFPMDGIRDVKLGYKEWRR